MNFTATEGLPIAPAVNNRRPKDLGTTPPDRPLSTAIRRRIVALGAIGFVPRGGATLATAACAGAFAVARPGPKARGLTVLVLASVGAAVAGSFVTEEIRDPDFIVIDEAAGVCLALLAVPSTPANCLVAAVAFRAIDKLKPGPIARIDSLRSGWSVMADDLAAGAAAGLIAFTISHLLAAERGMR